jgi:hypothetical protein
VPTKPIVQQKSFHRNLQPTCSVLREGLVLQSLFFEETPVGGPKRIGGDARSPRRMQVKSLWDMYSTEDGGRGFK